MTAADVVRALQQYASPVRAKASLWFFKTGKGEYGYGDKFIGIRGSVQRKIAKQYRDLPLTEVGKLLRSRIHEHRQTALFILVLQYRRNSVAVQKEITDLFLRSTQYINNWDLVDCSASHILGKAYENKPRAVLYRLARSKNLWERRIAILTTQHFIRQGDFKDTLKIAEMLLHDQHDLMHKAVGWMLREVGNRDLAVEERFLKKHYQTMPRTMLRYAIEKFPEAKRKKYLGK